MVKLCSHIGTYVVKCFNNKITNKVYRHRSVYLLYMYTFVILLHRHRKQLE